MTEATKIVLHHPIEVGDKVYTEITLARLLLRHLKVLDGVRGEVERSAILISALSG